jgi:hypothetical protein
MADFVLGKLLFSSAILLSDLVMERLQFADIAGEGWWLSHVCRCDCRVLQRAGTGVPSAGPLSFFQLFLQAKSRCTLFSELQTVLWSPVVLQVMVS